MQKLPVPENISLQKEVIKNLSWKDMRRCIVAALPVLLGVVIYWSATEDPLGRLVAMGIAVLYLFGLYGFFGRPDGNQSIYSFITRWLSFMKSQKFYRYCQPEEAIYYEPEDQN